MPIDPITTNANMMACSDLIRDAWDAGDRKLAIALIRNADALTLKWIRIRSTVDPEMKLAVDQEQYRRMTEP
jgi:hypothetical protein